MKKEEVDYYGTNLLINEETLLPKWIGEDPDPADDPYFRTVMDFYIKARFEMKE